MKSPRFKHLPPSCYKKFMEQASAAILILQDNHIIYHNQKVMQISGYTSEELLSTPFHQFIHPDDRDRVQHYYQLELLEKKCERHCEFRILTKTQEVRWIEKEATLIQCNGKPAILAFMDDITQKRDLELRLENALLERTWGLHHIHHTVKNNLHILSSLINLQNQIKSDLNADQLLRETRNRILSLAKIHDYLSRSENFLFIPLLEFFTDLTRDLLRASSIREQDISINIQGTYVQLNVSQAITAGMIINELISYMIHHGSSPASNQQRQIEVLIQQDGDIIGLDVRDNGRSLLPIDDIRTAESLSLQLVLHLTESQLKGELNYSKKAGSAFHITFRENRP